MDSTKGFFYLFSFLFIYFFFSNLSIHLDLFSFTVFYTHILKYKKNKKKYLFGFLATACGGRRRSPAAIGDGDWPGPLLEQAFAEKQKKRGSFFKKQNEK